MTEASREKTLDELAEALAADSGADPILARLAMEAWYLYQADPSGDTSDKDLDDSILQRATNQILGEDDSGAGAALLLIRTVQLLDCLSRLIRKEAAAVDADPAGFAGGYLKLGDDD